MTKEFVELVLCAASEYASNFMQYEYGYPLLFARLCFDGPHFAQRLSLVRKHYTIIHKYENLAYTNPDARKFLDNISILQKPSVRSSWILWSNTGENKLTFAAQDERSRDD